MRAFKRSLPFLIILLLGTHYGASASSQSLLDPYANIQPSSSKSFKNPVQNLAPMQNANGASTTTSTYVTMPVSQGKKDANAKAGSGGIMASMSEIKDGCAMTIKGASSGFLHGTKAAGARVAQGGRLVRDSMVKGSSKVRSGITTGARVSGQYIVRGTHAIGQGLKTTGERVKDGAGVVGDKVVSLPKVFGRRGDKNDQMQASIQDGATNSQQAAIGSAGGYPNTSGVTEKVPLAHKLKSGFSRLFKRGGDNEPPKATASSNPTQNLPQ